MDGVNVRHEIDRNLVEAVRRARGGIAAVARADSFTFANFILKDEETGEPVIPVDFHAEWHDAIKKNQRLLIWSSPELGKALALDTPIPTPDGWKTMGELKVGDRVFGQDGKACNVVFATPIMLNHSVYEVTFDDRSVIKADADHLWLAYQRGKKEAVVVTTERMRQTLKCEDGKKSVWRVPVTRAVEYEAQALSVHPYVLGYWLGNGHKGDAQITFNALDVDIIERILDLENGKCGGIRTSRGAVTISIGGDLNRSTNFSKDRLRYRLRELGVLDRKHIPRSYLQASVEQRRELLAGLLDSDGSIADKSFVEYSSTSKELADGVVELLSSLGFKARISQHKTMLNGRVLEPHWRVTFTAREVVFWGKRKREKQDRLTPTQVLSRKSVVAIREIPSEPVRCIQVDSSDHTYLAGRQFTVTHNTQQISIAYSLWALGNDPTLRIVVISKTAALSKAIIATSKHLIESSNEVHEVFPDLRREDAVSIDGRGKVTRAPWTAHKITVKRPVFSKDPSLQAYGQGSKGITGSRIDILILDDILTDDNTRTKKQRDQIWNWLQSTVFDRMSRRGKVIFMGNAWHPDDVMHRLAKNKRYKAMRYPALGPNGEINFPQRWTKQRIEEVMNDLGTLEGARKLKLVPFDETEKRFKRDMIERCTIRGKGYSTVQRVIDPNSGFSTLPSEFAIVHGVDVSTGEGRDRSCIFTLLWHPNENLRQVLRVKSGKWQGPEIVKEIDEASELFGGIFIVENNAAQQFILQFTRAVSPAALRAFTTGKNKADPRFGLESIAVELENMRWIIPSSDGSIEGVEDPEVAAWLAEMDEYRPTEHPGDRLMASWFAREGVRAHEAIVGAGKRAGGARVVGAAA